MQKIASLPTPGLSLRAPQGAPSPAPRRLDTFVKSAPPLVLMPRPGQLAEPKPVEDVPNTQSGPRKTNLALIAGLSALTLAGVGVGAAMVQQRPAPVMMSQVQAERAGEDLHYLQGLGGFQMDSPNAVGRLVGHHPAANSQQAFQALAEGRTLYFTPAGQTQAVPVRGCEQLRTLTRQVRDARFKSGVRAVGEQFKEIGQRIGDRFRDAFQP